MQRRLTLLSSVEDARQPDSSCRQNKSRISSRQLYVKGDVDLVCADTGLEVSYWARSIYKSEVAPLRRWLGVGVKWAKSATLPHSASWNAQMEHADCILYSEAWFTLNVSKK